MMAGITRREAVASFGLVGAALGMTGCTAPPPPPVRKFYARAIERAPDGLPSADWSLVVEPVQTLPALRTNRIAQVVAENEFDYYADAEWGDTVPQMVQGVVIRSFERAGAPVLVASERDRLRPDFLLNIRLLPFYAVGAIGTAPEARVGFEANLVRARGREVVASTSIQAARRAASADIDAIVAAFDEANRQAMADLIIWVVSSGNGTRAAD
jgi:cholesterol transport system auxiliary component